MKPERRLVFYLDDQSARDDDGAGDHDDEHRGAIAGIDEGVIKAAVFANRPQGEESRVEFSYPATRAFAGKPAHGALEHCGQGFISHTHLSGVPDAVRHSACRSAEPGPPGANAVVYREPGSAAHRFAYAKRCVRRTAK